MKNCPNCGEGMKLKNGFFTCQYCGTTVKDGFIDEEKKPEPEKPIEKKPEDFLEAVERAKTELIERCALSVTKIYNYCTVGLFTGSGWVGSRNCIITNAHVVENPDNPSLPSSGRIEVEFSNKLKLYGMQKIECRIAYYNRVEDIAILIPIGREIPSEVPILKINTDAPKQGELVFTIGNPLHYRFTYTEGSVANPEYNQSGSKRKYPVLQTTITLNHGNSGGAVFNSKGHVVGMSTFSELERKIVEENNPLLELVGEGSMKKETFEEIKGYGFCVIGRAIQDALDSIAVK